MSCFDQKGTDSPPVKKPPIISCFYTDEEHVANKISEGPNQTNSKYTFSLFPKSKPFSSLPAKPTTHAPPPLAMDSKEP